MDKSLETYTFKVDIDGDVISSDGPKPIFSSNRDLIGAFNLLNQDTIQAFVSGKEYPEALKVSVGDSFWFTPREDEIEGKVVYAMLTEVALDNTSILISAQLSKR